MAKLSLARKLAAVLLAVIAGVLVLSTIYGGHPKLWATPGGEISWTTANSDRDGNISVRAGTPRSEGYRIGDIIPVSVVIVAKQNVQLDISDVLNGAISEDDGQSFELVETPKVSQFEQDGMNVWRIDFVLRSWKVEPTLDFQIDVRYGIYWDGQTNWYTLSSPVVTFGTTRSATADDQFDFGDARPRQAPANAFGHTLVFLGGWLLLCLAVRAGFKYGSRLHRKLTQLSPEEEAWRVFDDVFTTARTNGWTEAHYVALSTQLRRYVRLEPLTASQVRALTPAELDRVPEQSIDILVRTFDLLEAAVYAQRELTSIERAQLETDLERIVPRKPVKA